MKLSIFTSYTNPDKRMDPWEESMACYEEYADEVVVVGQNWPNEFSFDYIGKTFQEGFDKSEGDWVIKLDIDTIFHEKDKKKLFYYLKKYEITQQYRYQNFKYSHQKDFTLKQI